VVQCSVADITDRIKGDINYGNGRIVKGTKLYMKYWAGGVSYPFKSHDLWFLTENIRWGKFEPTLDTKRFRQGQPRRPVARRGQDSRRRRGGHSGVHIARQGTFFDGKVFDPPIRRPI